MRIYETVDNMENSYNRMKREGEDRTEFVVRMFNCDKEGGINNLDVFRDRTSSLVKDDFSEGVYKDIILKLEGVEFLIRQVLGLQEVLTEELFKVDNLDVMVDLANKQRRSIRENVNVLTSNWEDKYKVKYGKVNKSSISVETGMKGFKRGSVALPMGVFKDVYMFDDDDNLTKIKVKERGKAEGLDNEYVLVRGMVGLQNLLTEVKMERTKSSKVLRKAFVTEKFMDFYLDKGIDSLIITEKGIKEIKGKGKFEVSLSGIVEKEGMFKEIFKEGGNSIYYSKQFIREAFTGKGLPVYIVM